MNYPFAKEFTEIKNELEKSQRVLLVAHSAPDGDTIGSVFALKEYISSFLGKEVKVTCSNALPQHLKDFLAGENVTGPEELRLSSFDLIIGCDAVERGFEKIVSSKNENQKIILLDHHTTLRMKKIKPDITVSDEKYSSVCEILYDFFDFYRIELNRKMAEFLLLGILGDTGIFQHANTTPKVMEIAAKLMRKGASISKIIRLVFKNKRLETLKLWGRAMERAEINPKTGAIMSYVTKQDLEELHGDAEDISGVAEILNTVSGTKFSLVLSERGKGRVKGSLRSEEYKNVDVSEIARLLRGGGHRLSSGFEIKGKLAKDGDGWKIE
ncbi:MAG: bifunctional oligoribonuclease/PAP phosphatase NrnA [Candidatus Moranbacteria bacterium]|nr:bifunctional oligoribonuclease/PAP phosphatase NrnA [Candidatus Moranbacteria bacterium]